jgi:hypothetical protein
MNERLINIEPDDILFNQLFITVSWKIAAWIPNPTKEILRCDWRIFPSDVEELTTVPRFDLSQGNERDKMIEWPPFQSNTFPVDDSIFENRPERT